MTTVWQPVLHKHSQVVVRVKGGGGGFLCDREGVGGATMPSNIRAGQKTKEKIEMLFSDRNHFAAGRSHKTGRKKINLDQLTSKAGRRQTGLRRTNHRQIHADLEVCPHLL